MSEKYPHYSRCLKCKRIVRCPCFPARKAPNVIFCAPHFRLLSKPYFRRLAIATANLGITRREIPNWMADVLFGYEGVIIDAVGMPVELRDTAIDDAFNDDGSFRWLSDFMRFSHVPMKQNPQYKLVARLTLIDLAFKIDKPDIARHFSR